MDQVFAITQVYEKYATDLIWAYSIWIWKWHHWYVTDATNVYGVGGKLLIAVQSSYGKSRARVLVGMDIDVVSLRAESDTIIMFSDC